jgi:hypothetical protein
MLVLLRSTAIWKELQPRLLHARIDPLLPLRLLRTHLVSRRKVISSFVLS